MKLIKIRIWARVFRDKYDENLGEDNRVERYRSAWWKDIWSLDIGLGTSSLN